MAGFTDTAFRSLCKQHGADVVLTEFVQSEPLRREVHRVWQSLRFPADQRPLGIQLFGADPASMSHAAVLLEERLRPDFIDLNFGCPAKNVIEQNAGASLLRHPALLSQIASAVVRAVPLTPVTAKIRTGWNSASISTADTARRLEDAGVRTITIHGRTCSQGYSGEANWDEIARAVAAVTLPVVGNGDIRDASSALLRIRQSGVAGIMIGRAALSNPWVFREIKAALLNQPLPAPPSENERLAALITFAQILDRQHNEIFGNSDDIRWMFPRLYPLTRALPGGRKLRASLSLCNSLHDLIRLCSSPAA
jgi:nifR3 family TIM-barrel protein